MGLAVFFVVGLECFSYFDKIRPTVRKIAEAKASLTEGEIEIRIPYCHRATQYGKLGLPVCFYALARRAPPSFRGGSLSSLRQLLAAHPVVLLLDSASTRVQVGLWTDGERVAPRWHAADDEAGVAVFSGAEALLAASGRSIGDVNAFIFCEGPGSVLGIRTAAMALRTWRVLHPAPVFAFQSLALVAQALADPAVSVIADARRDSWHVAKLATPLRRVPTAELTGDLVMPEHFRHWTPLPAHVRRTPYDLAALLPPLSDVDLFQPAPEPDAFLHEEPAYATWTPQVHQAAPGRGKPAPLPATP